MERYIHYGWNVWVDPELKGKHREHCLCYKCGRFAPATDNHCPIANENFKFCQKYGMTTPVYECPWWEPTVHDVG